ncbi:MAG TPA: response regulator [Rhizomicrobium sp.]|jgi:CheY-like chemotaxis protein|nr:response regulator [Rhizomicrobium sp.]
MSDKPVLLLAEDEAMLRLLATEMLEEAGFQVFEAADGVEGLELLKSHPEISLLVSDIKMPRMDGYALAEAGLALKPDLKILLMTGYAQAPPPALLKQAEVQILHKPFNLERLCALAAELTQS